MNRYERQYNATIIFLNIHIAYKSFGNAFVFGPLKTAASTDFKSFITYDDTQLLSLSRVDFQVYA